MIRLQKTGNVLRLLSDRSPEHANRDVSEFRSDRK